MKHTSFFPLLSLSFSPLGFETAALREIEIVGRCDASMTTLIGVKRQGVIQLGRPLPLRITFFNLYTEH